MENLKFCCQGTSSRKVLPWDWKGADVSVSRITGCFLGAPYNLGTMCLHSFVKYLYPLQATSLQVTLNLVSEWKTWHPWGQMTGTRRWQPPPGLHWAVWHSSHLCCPHANSVLPQFQSQPWLGHRGPPPPIWSTHSHICAPETILLVQPIISLFLKWCSCLAQSWSSSWALIPKSEVFILVCLWNFVFLFFFFF